MEDKMFNCLNTSVYVAGEEIKRKALVFQDLDDLLVYAKPQTSNYRVVGVALISAVRGQQILICNNGHEIRDFSVYE